MAKTNITEIVRERYAKAAEQAAQGVATGCSSGCCGSPQEKLFGIGLYNSTEVQKLPTLAAAASLGCGNPTALAGLKPGEIVLDLGSGGGIDCFLAAEKVGPTGYVYGLDMTEEMLALAHRNLAQTALQNVSFIKGKLDDIPLPDESVDVVISNCVINLVPDKDKVLREVFRVLRPGGRIAIADVVLSRPLPDEIRNDQAAWTG